MKQQYKNDFLNYYTDTAVKSECADITFINQGSTNVTINSALLLRPGNSITLSANAQEIDLTIYNIQFTSVPGLSNQLIVIRKIYIG